ncbi:hypothetical protein ACJROX_27580 [Pseudalkalibacillus sp. A8]|uniref:hypothetical protein n=1 Tax=Pseudalkalibacillus sp. A8 TaxID=3382641 RepID=UPI0038B59FB1
MNQFCKNITLNVLPEEKPNYISTEYWSASKGMGVLCGYPNNTGTFIVTAQNLVPSGVYTAWFVTDNGAYPSAPKNVIFTEDGYDPNRLIVNSKGQLQYYIAQLDYNPFEGIPTNDGKMPVRKIVLAFHQDNTTHGLKPGPHISHLSGEL